jgi:hypothetical protein
MIIFCLIVVLDNEVQSTSNSIENMEVNNDNEDDDNQRENPLFVRVNLDKEDNDKEGSSKEDLLEEDPIASDGFINENQEGADEELCIIPDTERVISQVSFSAGISNKNSKITVLLDTCNITLVI